MQEFYSKHACTYSVDSTVNILLVYFYLYYVFVRISILLSHPPGLLTVSRILTLVGFHFEYVSSRDLSLCNEVVSNALLETRCKTNLRLHFPGPPGPAWGCTESGHGVSLVLGSPTPLSPPWLRKGFNDQLKRSLRHSVRESEQQVQAGKGQDMRG